MLLRLCPYCSNQIPKSVYFCPYCTRRVSLGQNACLQIFRPILFVGLCIFVYLIMVLLPNTKITSSFAPTPFPTVAVPKAPSPGMVLIPAGTFQMGSNQGDADEKPVHTVNMNAFLMDVYEVSNANYARCVNVGKCPTPAIQSSYTRSEYYSDTRYSNYPVINVSWNEANTYCQWRGARLPTEAEWEKAAQGGLQGKLYAWGDTPPGCSRGSDNGAQFANCSTNDTLAVGSFVQNGYGLFDMTGNVNEWVNDWYVHNQYGVLQNSNPSGPPGGETRVVRGGGWNTPSINLRVADRDQLNSASRRSDLGFRCAASLP